MPTAAVATNRPTRAMMRALVVVGLTVPVAVARDIARAIAVLVLEHRAVRSVAGTGRAVVAGRDVVT